MSAARELKGQVCVVVGAQWGDEGKGKIVDALAGQYDLCCRYNGGSNAGHTLVVSGKRFALHLVPSGILHEGVTAVIGHGTVLHLKTLLNELESLRAAGVTAPETRLKISDRAHIVFDFHMRADGLQEGTRAARIGTTGRGIGPAYADKAARTGVRVGDLLRPTEFAEKVRRLAAAYNVRFPELKADADAEVALHAEMAKTLGPMICDTVAILHTELRAGKRVLAEGANASLLDIDLGTYPFVTSSHVTSGGAAVGLGIGPTRIGDVVGVVKAYTTRVGEGPFPTELARDHPIGRHLESVGHEVGTTTGRPRRCGWLDIPLLKFTAALNGFTSANLTKLDVLTGIDTIRVCVAYKLHGKVLPDGLFPAAAEDLRELEPVYRDFRGWKEDIAKCRKVSDLPEAAREYVNFVQASIECPILWIGVGADREDTATP